MTTPTLSATARVWIYQAHTPFRAEDIAAVNAHLQEFARQWVSHNNQLLAEGTLLHDRFVVLAVDESQAGASGCSIDSSVKFIKQLGAQYDRDLFNRMRFSYEKDGEVHTVSRDEFGALYASGAIHDDTIVFDTLVDTVEKLHAGFRKPLKDSWHARFV